MSATRLSAELLGLRTALSLQVGLFVTRAFGIEDYGSEHEFFARLAVIRVSPAATCTTGRPCTPPGTSQPIQSPVVGWRPRSTANDPGSLTRAVSRGSICAEIEVRAENIFEPGRSGKMGAGRARGKSGERLRAVFACTCGRSERRQRDKSTMRMRSQRGSPGATPTCLRTFFGPLVAEDCLSRGPSGHR